MIPAAPTVIGSAGVGLLLTAFTLNVLERLGPKHRGYLLLNVIGAGLACWASVLLQFVPFVVLEGTWCVAAFVGLVTPRGGGDCRP